MAISSGSAEADEAVLALVDELGRGVVGVGDDDARHAEGGRLDDDETVALATRWQHHAQRSGQRVLELVAIDEVRGARDVAAGPTSATCRIAAAGGADVRGVAAAYAATLA